MLRRMFLCWRWWRRDDLPTLLHSTLDSSSAADLPELHGFDRFERATRGAFANKEGILDKILLARVIEQLAGRPKGEEFADASCLLGERQHRRSLNMSV